MTADLQPANLSFLPWARQGAAAAIDVPDSLAPNQPAFATLNVGLQVNTHDAGTVPVRLRGPADVLGIDPHQVLRTDPRADSRDFESNLFASIEFDRPDFPWLFTPAAANGAGRLRPWLGLMIIRKVPGIALTANPAQLLPVLSIASPAKHTDELPDLADSWAWAHAQAATAPAGVQGALDGPPEQALSRLLCPRLLAPDTDYLACVVPTFELGRRAGLGLPVTAADLASATALAPAWTQAPLPASATLQLPVYFSWSFHTGPGGDFLALASALHHGVPAGLGQRSVDVRHPGFALPADFPVQAVRPFEGALRPLAAADTPVTWTDAPGPAFQKALADDILNLPAQQPAAQPLLAPPLYGRWHAGRDTVTPGAANWFDTLNLDPRWRAAAGIGTQVVQQHQEALMASAWDQAAETPQANRRRRQLQMSMAVGESLHRRHLVPMNAPAPAAVRAAAAAAPASPSAGIDRLLRFAAPVMGRIRLPAAPGLAASAGRTLVAKLGDSTLPVAAVRSAMRRIGRQRGPLTRRANMQKASVSRSTTESWVVRLNDGSAQPHAVLPPAIDQARLPALPTLAALQAAIHHRGSQVAAENQPLIAPPAADALPGAWDYPGRFRSAALEHLARIKPPAVLPEKAHLRLDDAAGQVVAQMHPRVALARLAQAVVPAGEAALPATARGVEPVGVESVLMTPTFPQPMFEPLAALSQDLLLPGLDTVQPETVLGLRTNRAFVESYLIGLNTEMGRELLWRGFPTDQQGTPFRFFWGSDGSVPATPDIDELRTRLDRPLGAPPSEAAPEQFVLLLRSALLQRYPNALIYLARTPDENPPPPEGQPIFNGRLEPDIAFFGFKLSPEAATGRDGHGGWYVVFQEHPTEPRFGLDADAAVRSTGRSHAGAAPGTDAAQVAALTRRQPVRVAIHASELVSTDTAPQP